MTSARLRMMALLRFDCTAYCMSAYPFSGMRVKVSISSHIPSLLPQRLVLNFSSTGAGWRKRFFPSRAVFGSYSHSAPDSTRQQPIGTPPIPYPSKLLQTAAKAPPVLQRAFRLGSPGASQTGACGRPGLRFKEKPAWKQLTRELPRPSEG
jgi:hypothetical protein